MRGSHARRVAMEKNSSRKPRVEVCPVCDGGSLTRRGFLRTVGGALAAGAAGGVIPASGLLARAAKEEASSTKPAETYVKMLFDTLTPEQRKVVHFPFEHDLRKKIANNWHIVDAEVAAIGKFYRPDQQE